MDELQIPYPDFQLGEIIDPEQHDLNNRYIQTKINEFVTFANTLTGSAGGASTITVAPIAPFTSTNVQAVLNDLIARIQATQVGISGSSLVGTPALVKLAGTTVEAQLKALDNLLQQAYVITTSIADGAVITVKLADGAVTDVKLADNSVITSKIIDNAVTQAKIAMSAVTTPKIADGAVTTIKIANNAVTQTQIAPNAVGTPEIINTSVTTQKLADSAVTTSKLASKSVTVDKIDDSLLTYLPQSTLTNRLLALEGLTGLNPVSKEQVLQAGSTSITTPVKSPVNVKRIVGKTIINHIPPFDSGALNKHANAVIASPNKLILNATESYQESTFSIPIKNANTTYTLSLTRVGRIDVQGWTGGAGTFVERYYQDATTINASGYKEITFTVNNASVKMLVIVMTNVGSGTFNFDNISLVEGTRAQPFVANVKGVTNPTIVNETNGTSLVVPTTLHDGEYVEQNEKGELIKYKKWQELVLDDSLNWAFRESKTGYKYVQAPYSYNNNLTVIGVKFDGTIMYHGGTINDNTLYSGVAGYIILPIKNTDSGWGQNYNPSPEEVKACILGWKMYNSSATNDGTGTYDNAGVKAWAYRHEGGFFTGATITLPTTQAPINSKWQPYRLIREIPSTFETIKPYGDLTLEKGENSVKVYAGRIVNNLIKPLGYQGNYYITSGRETVLFERLEGIFKNNVNTLVSWSKSTTSTGSLKEYFISEKEYDPTASYAVDFDPIYTWQITTPINAVQLSYYETIQAVTNELVHDVAKQQDTVKRMLENVVNEEEKPKLIQITMFNMTNGWIRLAHHRNGMVEILVSVSGGVWVPGKHIGKIPPQYIPATTMALFGMQTDRAPYNMEGLYYVDTFGNIVLGINTSIPNGAVLANAQMVAQTMYFKEK